MQRSNPQMRRLRIGVLNFFASRWATKPNVNPDARTTVVVVGPAPGQAGGISSVMSYLNGEIRNDVQFHVTFLDTLKNERWSVGAFVWVAARAVWTILRSRISRNKLLFHLNVSTGGSTLRKWFISVICRVTGTPYVVHLHGSKYRRFFSSASPAIRWIALQLFGSARRVVVLGRTWHDYAVTELNVNEGRVVTVANGTPRIANIPSDPLVSDAVVRVIFSGRLSQQKGVPELLTAADNIYDKFQNFELVLMGDSRDESLLLEARSREYCRVTGWLSHEDVVRELSSSDIFTLPSHDEGLPMAMIEAMSLAMPVVVTNVGAISDVVDDGHEGFLIEPGDVDALRTALEMLILDPDLRSVMGRKAEIRWSNELEARHMATQIKQQWRTASSEA